MIVPHLLRVSAVPEADPGLAAQTRLLIPLGNGDRADHKLAVPAVLADRIVVAHRKVDHKVDLHRVDRKVVVDRARILLALSTMYLNSMQTATA
jgi:hypothetical protein